MNDSRLIALCIVVLMALAIFGGGLVASGLAIGFLTACAFLVLAMKSRLIRGFARRFPLLADLLATVVGYLLFPAGVTAFVAAGVVALLVTIMIAVDRVRAGLLPTPTITAQMSADRAAGPGGLLGRIQPH